MDFTTIEKVGPHEKPTGPPGAVRSVAMPTGAAVGSSRAKSHILVVTWDAIPKIAKKELKEINTRPYHIE